MSVGSSPGAKDMAPWKEIVVGSTDRFFPAASFVSFGRSRSRESARGYHKNKLKMSCAHTLVSMKGVPACTAVSADPLACHAAAFTGAPGRRAKVTASTAKSPFSTSGKEVTVFLLCDGVRRLAVIFQGTARVLWKRSNAILLGRQLEGML